MGRMFGDLAGLVAGEDELREKWRDPDLRAQFLAVLDERGYDLGRLEDIRGLIDARDTDILDVLAFVRIALEPKDPPRPRQ